MSERRWWRWSCVGFRGSSSRAWCCGFRSLVLGALPVGGAVVVGCSTQRLFHTQARDRLTHTDGLSRDGVRWYCSP